MYIKSSLYKLKDTPLPIGILSTVMCLGLDTFSFTLMKGQRYEFGKNRKEKTERSAAGQSNDRIILSWKTPGIL